MAESHYALAVLDKVKNEAMLTLPLSQQTTYFSYVHHSLPSYDGLLLLFFFYHHAVILT